MDLSLEYSINNPQYDDNIAFKLGFDPSVVAWSEDAAVQAEIARLLSHGVYDARIGSKSLAGLDLSAEKPFNLSTAVFEDVDMQELRLPKGTDLSFARFVGCNLYNINFEECITE